MGIFTFNLHSLNKPATCTSSVLFVSSSSASQINDDTHRWEGRDVWRQPGLLSETANKGQTCCNILPNQAVRVSIMCLFLFTNPGNSLWSHQSCTQIVSGIPAFTWALLPKPVTVLPDICNENLSVVSAKCTIALHNPCIVGNWRPPDLEIQG